MLVIGIDPGEGGGIAFMDGTIVTATRMPPTEHGIVELLAETDGERFAFIEDVHSFPGQGVSSSFKFGRCYGLLRGLLAGMGIPFEAVAPLKWQGAMGIRVKGKVSQTVKKNLNKACAQRLWPGTKWTHATSDCALIAEYGRRVLYARGLVDGAQTNGG